MAKKSSKKKKKSNAKIVVSILFLLVLAALGISNGTGTFTYDDLMQTFGFQKTTKMDSDLSVHFINVGQGDSILIQGEDTTVLIDAGEKEYGETVANYISSLGIEKLDYIISTHPHSDHAGGLPYVMQQFDVKTVIMPEIKEKDEPTTSSYENLLEAIAESGAEVDYAKVGQTYGIDGGLLEILGPVDYYGDEYNNMSVVSELTFGESTFLFMGDAEKESEKDMLKEDLLSEVDVLKVGHHGSSTSSTEDFLDVVSPDYAVIMCGDSNSYNHPNEDTVERLLEYTDKIYRTDRQGTVVFETDGKDISVSYDEYLE